jgi:hypothetical protein
MRVGGGKEGGGVRVRGAGRVSGGGGINRPSTPLFSNVTPYHLGPAISSRFLIYCCLHSNRTALKGQSL